MNDVDDFDYLPGDPWPAEDAYPDVRQPMGRHRDARQPAYPPAVMNGTRTSSSDDRAARGYPPVNGRTPGYPPPNGRPASGSARPGSGPMPAYRPSGSGSMPAYQPPEGTKRAYQRPGRGPFPAYILPNGGGVAQGYPLISDRLAPAYPPPDDRAAFGYVPADSGPMPAYRPLQGRPARGYYPSADDRVAFGYPPVDGRRILSWLPFGNRLVLLPRGTQFGGDQELREHRDVSGGWLRPAVFGAMDGLVTNSSLIAGIGGGGGGHGMIVLTGIAGLIAGAFSMATGEYISVTSQNELTAAEVELERMQHLRDPRGKLERLTEIFIDKGVSPNLAEAVVRQISADPERAVNTHVREELGIDPDDLPSPRTAAAASFAAFTVGALIPLSPFLLGYPVLTAALVTAGAAAVAGGAAVAKLTGRSPLVGGLRQFTAAFLATGLAFAIGHLISGHV
jgi:vacuolar iron transporter family protein